MNSQKLIYVFMFLFIGFSICSEPGVAPTTTMALSSSEEEYALYTDNAGEQKLYFKFYERGGDRKALEADQTVRIKFSGDLTLTLNQKTETADNRYTYSAAEFASLSKWDANRYQDYIQAGLAIGYLHASISNAGVLFGTDYYMCDGIEKALETIKIEDTKVNAAVLTGVLKFLKGYFDYYGYAGTGQVLDASLDQDAKQILGLDPNQWNSTGGTLGSRMSTTSLNRLLKTYKAYGNALKELFPSEKITDVQNTLGLEEVEVTFEGTKTKILKLRA